MHRNSRTRALGFLGGFVAVLGLLTAVGSTGCAEPSEEIVNLPGYPPFTLAVSPGVAPGETDGCDGDQPPVDRMLGTFYAIPEDTRLLPKFENLSPIATVCLDRLDITPRRSVYPAFPGLKDRYRWFATDLHGTFAVDNPGVYDFRLTSDDGSQLYIDDTLVVDNDGYHPPRLATARAQLAPGRHTLRVEYWQGPGPLALVLEVTRPGEPYHVFRVDEPL